MTLAKPFPKAANASILFRRRLWIAFVQLVPREHVCFGRRAERLPLCLRLDPRCFGTRRISCSSVFHIPEHGRTDREPTRRMDV